MPEINLGDILSYYGSWASLIGIPFAMAGLLLTKSVRDTIVESRFEKHATRIMTRMREAESKGNSGRLIQEIEIFVHAIETSYSWPQRKFSTRIKKMYKEAKKQSNSAKPNIIVLDGLLTNFKVLHAGSKP